MNGVGWLESNCCVHQYESNILCVQQWIEIVEVWKFLY
jgi:hypothetical protein